MASGWNLWVWLVSVVSRRQLWLVGGIYGCGYQEVGVAIRRWVWLVGIGRRYVVYIV